MVSVYNDQWEWVLDILNSKFKFLTVGTVVIVYRNHSFVDCKVNVKYQH